MSEQFPPEPGSQAILQREVARVLADPVFLRSSVQSRLLAYLCARTVASNGTISQTAVAVEGLGRTGTAGRLSESYPRVQISRLRSNLARYYARCAPGEGLAVHIRHGDYHLRLAPPESVYGSPSGPWRPTRGTFVALFAAIAAGLLALAAGLVLVDRLARQPATSGAASGPARN